MVDTNYEERRERHQRPAILTREELRDIHVKLAVLSEKLDRVLEDRARLTRIEEKVAVLEQFNSHIRAWGVIGGGVWSLILTLIGLKVWS